MKKLKSNINEFIKEAEELGFKVTKNEIEVKETNEGPIPAAVRFKLPGGRIEIQGDQKFVERYLYRIKNTAYGELAEGLKNDPKKEINLLVSKNLITWE